MPRRAQPGPTRIIVHGTGRMARAIATTAAAAGEPVISALVGPQPPDWETTSAWFSALSGLTVPGARLPDLLIDFSLPEGTRAAAQWCGEHVVPLLSGVTGLPPETLAALRETARRVPVLWSPNLSLGVNLLADLAARAAAVLDAGTPVLIEDIHHQWKKDLEGADKTFRNSMRLWAVTSDNHMEKFGFFGELLKYICSKVDATIGNQELQMGR